MGGKSDDALIEEDHSVYPMEDMRRAKKHPPTSTATTTSTTTTTTSTSTRIPYVPYTSPPQKRRESEEHKTPEGNYPLDSKRNGFIQVSNNKRRKVYDERKDDSKHLAFLGALGTQNSEDSQTQREDLPFISPLKNKEEGDALNTPAQTRGFVSAPIHSQKQMRSLLKGINQFGTETSRPRRSSKKLKSFHKHLQSPPSRNGFPGHTYQKTRRFSQIGHNPRIHSPSIDWDKVEVKPPPGIDNPVVQQKMKQRNRMAKLDGSAGFWATHQGILTFFSTFYLSFFVFC